MAGSWQVEMLVCSLRLCRAAGAEAHCGVRSVLETKWQLEIDTNIPVVGRLKITCL